MTPVYGWVCLMPVKKEKKKKGVLGSVPTLLVYRGKRFYIWTLSNQLALETSLLVIQTVATAMTFNRGNGYSRRKDFQRFSNLFFLLSEELAWSVRSVWIILTFSVLKN